MEYYINHLSGYYGVTMSIKQIESIMTGLGFTAYEARAYTALVRESPLTGYELSKKSGIPGSKVYECIERLNRKRLITQVGDNPSRYVAVPPEELVNRLSRDFDTSVKNLADLLKKDSGAETVDYIFNMYGYDDVIGKAVEMISRAEHSLDLSLWGQETSILGNEIDNAVRRGVNVRLLSFNGAIIEGVDIFHHRPLSEDEATGRWITVVKDQNEVLTGRCSGEGAIVAAWTRNICLVFISGKYIEHEIIKIRDTDGQQPKT